MRAVQSEGTLMCAVNLDQRAPGLVAAARRWATATRSRLLFVHALPRAGRVASSDVRAEMAALEIDGHELQIVTGAPAGALSAAIVEHRPTLVLVASSATNGDRIGSVCGALVRDAAWPVAVLPPVANGLSGGPIACAMSLGDDDEAAIRYAGALADVTGRRLVLGNAVGAQDAARVAAARASTTLGIATGGTLWRPAAAGGVRDAGAPVWAPGDVATRGDVLADRLIDLVRRTDADALVMASRPGDPTPNALLDPLKRRLWTAAPCPVIVVRP